MVTSIKVRAPVLGGNFAVWSGMFNAGDCLIAGIRGKEDPWNAIMSGAATGGLLAARSGPKAMIASSVVGGIILAVMEGVGVMMNRFNSDQFKPQAPMLPEVSLPELQPSPSNQTQSSPTEFANEETMKDQVKEVVKPKGRFGF